MPRTSAASHGVQMDSSTNALFYVCHLRKLTDVDQFGFVTAGKVVRKKA